MSLKQAAPAGAIDNRSETQSRAALRHDTAMYLAHVANCIEHMLVAARRGHLALGDPFDVEPILVALVKAKAGEFSQLEPPSQPAQAISQEEATLVP